MDSLEFQECCIKAAAKVTLTDEEKKELIDNSLPDRGEKEVSASDIEAVAKSIVGNL